MDSSQTSSFIPKSPVRGNVAKRKVRKVYVITYVIYIVFLGVLIASAFVWFLKMTATSGLSSIQADLAAEKTKFNQSDMAMVLELSERMEEAYTLLNQRVYLESVFDALEAVTAAPVFLTGMEYKKDEGAKLVLSLTARATDFNAVRFQRQLLSTSNVLAGAKITNVEYGVRELTENGTSVKTELVVFSIEKDLNPADMKKMDQNVSISAPAVMESDTDVLELESEEGEADIIDNL